MALTRDEMKHFLALVAVLDGIDTDDPLLLSGWVAMSEKGEWPSFNAAKQALLVYRTEQPNYPLRPGHITQVLQRVRAAASAAYVKPRDDEFPQEALDDPRAYQRFVNARVAAHHAAHMASFERGEQRAIEAAS